MSKLRPIAITAAKTASEAQRPLALERKLAIHQAAQTLRVAADVLVGVECGEPLLNFRVRGLASAVRGVVGELDSILIADDRAAAFRRAEAGA